MKLNFNLLYIKSLLMLVGLVACVSSMAMDMEPLTSTQQNTENLVVSPDQTGMHWSMLPGESLNDVARLFYPNNKHMQRRFISKTLLLSGEIQPNLDPAATFSQKSLIIIPNIKSLARQSVNHKSGQSKLNKKNNLIDTAKLEMSPKIQADYDYLVERNAFFKQELEKLNIKLAYLQQILGSLKDEVMRIVNRVLPAPAAVIAPPPAAVIAPIPAAKLVKQKQDADIQNNHSQDTLIKNHTAESTQVTAPISTSVQTALVSTGQALFISPYLLMSILAILFVISLFLGLGLYTRREVKNIYPSTAGGLGKLDKKIFNKDNNHDVVVQQMCTIQALDSLVTQSELAGDMLVKDLNANWTPDYKGEGELVLEQAKVYISINRAGEAIELLKAQIEAAPKNALHHWLYLLDIYRDSNQKEEFLYAAKQLHQNFNVMIPQWKKTPLPPDIAVSLEAHPHIIAKLTELWPNYEKDVQKFVQVKDYLDELLIDNREHERIGFSLEVFNEILLLRNILDVRERLALED